MPANNKNEHPSYSVSFLYLRVTENQTTNTEHPSYIVSFLYLCGAGSLRVSETRSRFERCRGCRGMRYEMRCKQPIENKHPSYSVSFLYLCVHENQTTNKEHPSYIVSFLCLRRAGSPTVSELPSHVEQYAS